MSRIGNRQIVVPESVDVKINGNELIAKGPKGELKITLKKEVKVELKDGVIQVTLLDDKAGNIHGLMRTLISNMVEGVSTGFSKKLLIVGVGYRAAKQGNKLNLTLGYSHPVVMDIPEGLEVEVPKPTEIIISGADKQLVGQFAANIRAKRMPEVYLGKGIKYEDEIIKRKVGKAGKTA